MMSHMWSWLGDVPDVAWAALITGAFLAGQQWFNNRRDDTRRRDDADERRLEREHAATQADETRSHELVVQEQQRQSAINDHWRNERAEIADEFFNICTVIELLNATQSALMTAAPEHAEKMWKSVRKNLDEVPGLDRMTITLDLRKVTSRVRTRCLPDTVDAAGALNQACSQILVTYEKNETPFDKERHEREATAFKSALGAYEKAVSRELATHGSIESPKPPHS